MTQSLTKRILKITCEIVGVQNLTDSLKTYSAPLWCMETESRGENAKCTNHTVVIR